MKRILLILASCLCLNGCAWIALGVVGSTVPKQEISFRVDGERFESSEDVSMILRIVEVSGEGFALSMGESNWATANTMEKAKIGLNSGFFDGSLKEDQKYCYNADDKMDFYPFFSYTVNVPHESVSGANVYKTQTIWFNATEGWIEITKINKKKQIVDGRFEFTAVCDAPSDETTINITSGRFKDVPYLVVSDKTN